MDKDKLNIVMEYQCPGCVCGHNTECYEKGDNIECSKHFSGTTFLPNVGKILLGLPKGFNRLGVCKDMKIRIFEKLSDGWVFDIFNVPVWKHKDSLGNTIVRGISPRLNAPFLHIFLENCLDSIDCIEITEEHLQGMD